MHEKLSADNLKVINSVQADEYVRVIGPIIATSVTKIINDAKLATAGQGRFADTGTAMAPNTNPLMYVKEAFPSFLRVRSMSEVPFGVHYSNTIESQEIDNESLLGDIDESNSNTMSTAISADPENADDDLDTAGGISANADQYTFANVTESMLQPFGFVNHKGSGMLFNMFANCSWWA